MYKRLPHFNNKTTSPIEIKSQDDFEEAYKSIRSQIIASGQFANPDIILQNLLSSIPGAADFLHKRRIRPDNIQVVHNHRNIIKSVNSSCWSYASLNPIFTLQDLYKLVEPHINEVGPIYSLPFIQQIFGVHKFNPSVVATFDKKELNEFRCSVDSLMNGIVACINRNRLQQPNTGEYSRNKWWESVITEYLLSTFHDSRVGRSRNLSFGDVAPYGIRIKQFPVFLNAVLEYSTPDKLISAKRRVELMIDRNLEEAYSQLLEKILNTSEIADFKRGKPRKALLRLGGQCLELYKKLKSYRQFNWPPGALEGLRCFGEALNSVLENMPFPGLLRVLMRFKYVSEITPEAVLQDLESTTIGEEEALSLQVGNVEQNPDAETGVELTDVVQKFNDFLRSLLSSADEVTEVSWQNLANLENNLGLKKSTSLLAALAEASSDESKELRPKCLNLVTRPQRDQKSSEEEMRVAADGDTAVDLSRVERFVKHVTFLAQRSSEDLLKIVDQCLSVPASPGVLKFIQGILIDTPTQSRFLIHPRDPSFSNVGSMSSSLPAKLTDRSTVLSLLASCPVLEDPEIWTLWCLPPSSNGLAYFWGSLEDFLSDSEVDENYNLAVVKVVNNGYIRLTVNGSLLDLETSIADCLSLNEKVGSRTLCDLLIGSSLLVNRNIPPEDSIRIVAEKVKHSSAEALWCQLVRRILLTTPLSLLGVLFSKILQPALSEDLIVMTEETDGLQSLLNSTAADPPERDRLVTAIGAVGGQLGWSQWLEVFTRYRLSKSRPTTSLPPPPPRVSVVLPQPLPSVSEYQKQVERPVISPDEDEIREPVINMEVSTSIEEELDRREFIETLRRKEFGLGVSLDAEASDILQRFQSRLGRSLEHLSGQLYGQPGHFVLELIQNADDNVYAPETVPCVHFSLSATDLVVGNNEARGFSSRDITALCDVGMSTKVGKREEMTGRKGIGFKSVFAFSDAPEVHSNGFHVRFRADGQSILTPEWISEGEVVDNSQWRTLFRLPFNREKAVEPQSVISFVSNLLTHHLILFLRRIDRIEFQTASNIPAQLNLELRRESRVLFTRNNPEPSSLKLVIVSELRNGRHQASQWLLHRRQISVDVEYLGRLPGADVKNLPNRTEIAIAIPLSTQGPLPTFPVFAFLPVRSIGFQFSLNADFDLTSSREDVDGNSVWNRFLVSQIPLVFASLVTSVIQCSSFESVPLSQREILGRILECLPLRHGRRNSSQTSSLTGIFVGLDEQIHKMLATIAWIPVRNETRFAPPSKVLLTTSQDTTDTESAKASLIRLLVERVGMQELDPAVLSSPAKSSDADSASEEEGGIDMRDRVDRLLALGAHRISADALIELTSKLSPRELFRHGMLYALLTNIDTGLRSASPQGGSGFMSLAQISAWKRRCLRRLSSLPIFPLTDGRLVSLDSVTADATSASGLLKNRNQLMIPPRPRSADGPDHTQAAYIRLLSDLGPLISPFAISPSNGVAFELPGILTASPDDFGLGLKVADSVEEVKNYWIVPHRSDFSSSCIDNSDWFIAAAQLLVVHSNQLDEELTSRLPVVCLPTAGGPMRFFDPKTDNAMLPKSLMQHLPASEEYEILSLVKKDMLTVEPSPHYFQLVDPENAQKWVDWFALTGLFTLRKIQPQKYRLGESPSALPLLPENHALRSSPALVGLKDPVVVDWLCPGLEKLVLPWIKTESEICGDLLSAALKTVCEKLAAFLCRHWMESFSSYTEAIAIETEDTDMTKGVSIGAASWLRSLRKCRWLLIENEDFSTALAPVPWTSGAVSPTNFVAFPAIYAPAALKPKQDGRPIPRDLLAHVCPVWKALEGMSGETLVEPGLLSAIGVKQALDEGTFEDLMACLRKTPDDQLPSALTIESILQVYELGIEILSSPALRRIFGSSILVPCCDRKPSKRRRTINSSASSPPYPSCHICEAKVVETDRKRASLGASGALFHMVPAEQTCWRQTRLPDPDENVMLGDEYESAEEEEEDVVLRSPVARAIEQVETEKAEISADRKVPLCDIYGAKWRKFFCETLGIRESSSLEDILALRPKPPLRADNSSARKWRIAQQAFGRRLATWYALIYSSLGGDISKEVTERLRDFPLLYDLAGSWRKPQVSDASRELFVWSATDLACLVPPKCVLGHSLKVLEADAEGTTKKQGSSLCDSHSLLLKVLKIKVLEESLDEVVTSRGFPLSTGVPVPSVVLNRAVKDFRAIARAWLASTKRAVSSSSSSSRNPTPLLTMDEVVGAEAFLVPDLGLQLTVSKSKRRVANVEECACRFHDGKLYVNERFKDDFKRSTGEDDSGGVPLPVLCTPNIDSKVSEGILSELTRAVFPTSLSDQSALLHFSRGLLNLWVTLAASKLPTESLTRQLRSYLSSHGIQRSSQAALLDTLLRRAGGEDASPVDMDLSMQPPTSADATTASPSQTEANSAFERASQRALEGMGRSFPSMLSYTRYQTHVYDAIAENASPDPRTPSLRAGFLEDDDLFSRAMASSAALSSSGREGEKAVYLNLQKRAERRHQEGFTFPTGHPDLGNGRLVSAVWINASGETLMPYDIEIHLEVAGSVGALEPQLKDAVKEGVIVEAPGGLLHVGPIFLEVKTTTSDNASGGRRRDLFELSLAEAACARQFGWRFHLVRLRQPRARAGHPASATEMEHIPNLANALQEKSAHMKLFVGIQQ